MKNKITIVIAVIVIIIASILNFPGINPYKDRETTIINLIVSISYLLIWIILTVYTYKKKNIIFSKFMFIYWSISTIMSVYLTVIYLVRTEMNLLLIPLFLIFYTPFDGVMKLIGTTAYLFILSTVSVVFTLIAVFINKHSKE